MGTDDAGANTPARTHKSSTRGEFSARAAVGLNAPDVHSGAIYRTITPGRVIFSAKLKSPFDARPKYIRCRARDVNSSALGDARVSAV